MLRLCKVVSKKVCVGYDMRHRLVAQSRVIILSQRTTLCSPNGWGPNMRSHITQFTIRMVVAIGIAFVGATAFGMVVAHSAFERAQVIAHFTKPVPKAEFRLSEHQQLRKTFLSH